MPVVRAAVGETTALGAALAAGLGVGYWRGLEEIRKLSQADRTFEPAMDAAARADLYGGWQAAVRAALCWAEEAAARSHHHD
jgi:glycerol kinase